jgi:phytanoyl-CoA hydroxylase
VKHAWYMGRNASWDERLASTDPEVRPLLEEFLEEGVAVVKGGISPEICDIVRSSYDALISNNGAKFDRYKDENGHNPRIINVQSVIPQALDLFAKNSRTLALCDTIFGMETVGYTSLYFQKGSEQEIHRDTPVFATKPPYLYLGVWVALEDVDAENGPLRVIRKGHLLPELDLEAIARQFYPDLQNIAGTDNDLWNSYQLATQAACADAGLEAESLAVKKGDTIIWHPHLPHGGMPVVDLTRTRHSFVMHVVPADTPVYHQDVFFNPYNEASDQLEATYAERDGRRFMFHGTADFGHKLLFSRDDLTWAPTEVE